MNRRILVLFDIDGTLLQSHGAGRRAFRRALRRVYGIEHNLDFINFAGNTDLNVVDQIRDRLGFESTPEQVDAFFRCMAEELDATLHESPLEIFPGVRELLFALERHPRMTVGLVTGNTERCARIKLRAFDLDGHFLLGAFGCEHADRVEIARLALRRAEAALPPGERFDRAFLIGDTPSDIRAAETAGLSSIAVATGSHSYEDLERCGAELVVRDLSRVDAVLAHLDPDRGAS